MNRFSYQRQHHKLLTSMWKKNKWREVKQVDEFDKAFLCVMETFSVFSQCTFSFCPICGGISLLVTGFIVEPGEKEQTEEHVKTSCNEVTAVKTARCRGLSGSLLLLFFDSHQEELVGQNTRSPNPYVIKPDPLPFRVPPVRISQRKKIETA